MKSAIKWSFRYFRAFSRRPEAIVPADEEDEELEEEAEVEEEDRETDEIKEREDEQASNGS